MIRLVLFVGLFAACGARSVRIGGFDAGSDASPCETDPVAEGCACVPQGETCNGLDDDCDGEVDEGVRNACGECGDGCRCWGAAPCSDWGERLDGVAQREDGAIEIARPAGADILWLTDLRQTLVYRLDSPSREIRASYWSSPAHSIEESDVAQDVALDSLGNAVVANRPSWGSAFPASMTKIAAADCPDGDGDGSVRTSGAVDDVRAFDSASSWADECILWHTVLGGDPFDEPGALVVQSEVGLDGATTSTVWVGMRDARNEADGSHVFPILAFDDATGEATGVELRGELPAFEAVLDRDEILWAATGWNFLLRVDPASPAEPGELVTMPTAADVDTVTADADGTLWTSGRGVYRKRVGEEEWRRVQMEPDFDYTGLVALDGAGSAWVGAANALYQIDDDDEMDVREHDPPPHDPSPLELAMDFEGGLWALGSGSANVIDTETLDQTWLFGDGPHVLPVTGSELTRYASWLVSHPPGSVTLRAEGCAAGPTEWTRVQVDADVPAETSVSISARTAIRPEEPAGEWMSLATIPPDGPDVDLQAAGLTAGDVIEIRIELLQSTPATPTLRSVELAWSCPDA